MIQLSPRGSRRVPRFASVLFLLPLLLPATLDAQERIQKANFKQAEKYSSSFLRQFSYSTSVSPNWIGKTDRFWYQFRTSSGTRYVLVDPEARTKKPLFDHDKLAAQLSEACKKALEAGSLSLGSLKIDDEGKKLTFVTEKLKFEYDLEKGELKNLGKAPSRSSSTPQSGRGGQRRTQERGRGEGEGSGSSQSRQRDHRALSPDKKSYVFAKGDDLYYVEGTEVTQVAKEGAEPADAKGKGEFAEAGAKVDGAKTNGDKEKTDGKKINGKTDTEKVDEKKTDKVKVDKEKTDGKKDGDGTTENGDAKENGEEGAEEKKDAKDEVKFEYDEKTAIRLSEDGEEDYSFKGRAVSRGQVNRRQNEERDRGNRERTEGGEEKSEEKKPDPAEVKTRPSVTWSKDSAALYTTRRDARGVQELFLVNSLAEPRPSLQKYKYPMPGEDTIRRTELNYLTTTGKKLVRVTPKWKDESYSNVHFVKGGHELRFIRRDRLLRNAELCSLDPMTGEVKVLIEEGTVKANLVTRSVRYLKRGDKDPSEMIWWSERTGWGHFYLYDLDGKLKNAITSGPFRASRIVDVDEEKGLVYFRGNGHEKGENIYYEHLYRVHLDGSGLTLLDPGDATHRSSVSKSKRYVVDNYSRVDLAPRSVLRDSDTNEELMVLEECDLSKLTEVGWKMPERFIVKAADGVTDLYGNMWKPFDFDPNKVYPIIANVYPGPQQEGVSHTFSAVNSRQQLAQIGFIVIQVGHRGGSPNRSKAYGSYGYFNLRDYGLADKKSAIEQLAARHSFIDVERVGMYGHSGGGFMTAAAMLQKPYNKFFTVGVSTSGNHDNNIYNYSWAERYHGLKEVEAKKDEKKGREGDAKSTGKEKKTDEGKDTVKTKDTGKEKKSDKAKDTVKTKDAGKEKKSDKAKDTVKTKDAGKEKKSDKAKDTVKTKDAGKEKKSDKAKNTVKTKDAGKEKKTDKAKDQGKTKDAGKQEKTDKTKDAGKDKAKDEKKADTKLEIKVPTNAELAENLEGHLLLVHGEIDNNVHPAGTMRLVDALIKANKRFDMLIIPGARHGYGRAQSYFTRRMWEYFAQHLIGDIPAGANMDVPTSTRR